MKYALIDTANTFFRALHVAARGAETWEKIGMALHLTLSSVNQLVRKHQIDHVVFCLEGRSWRKNLYPAYKANRKVTAQARTEEEQEESKMFWETFDAFATFLQDKTNTSVLRVSNAEADDIIARFIDLHPDDEHVILSTDTDFVQLIKGNVSQYNGVTGELLTKDGYFDEKGKPVKDKKTKQPKLLEDVEYLLFKKIVRGDSTDNVFSAYPGVREKGAKDKIGIKDAFDDRSKQGFKWNNFMLQKWVDHEGVEHRVRDDFERNRVLIDLTAQPEDIKVQIDDVIRANVRTQSVSMVGIHFMKFCGKYELKKISEQAETFSRWLNVPYEGILREGHGSTLSNHS